MAPAKQPGGWSSERQELQNRKQITIQSSFQFLNRNLSQNTSIIHKTGTESKPFARSITRECFWQAPSNLMSKPSTGSHSSKRQRIQVEKSTSQRSKIGWDFILFQKSHCWPSYVGEQVAEAVQAFSYDVVAVIAQYGKPFWEFVILLLQLASTGCCAPFKFRISGHCRWTCKLSFVTTTYCSSRTEATAWWMFPVQAQLSCPPWLPCRR